MPQKKKLPFVTVGFVAVNVLVYVILEILGNTENSELDATPPAIAKLSI